MPARTWLQAAARALFQRTPSAQTFAMGVQNLAAQIVLLPFRRRRVQGSPEERVDLLSRTDAYNRAAERYFEDFSNPGFLTNKPFSETPLFGKHLIDVGVLVNTLKLQPGDVVLEFGAGSCWLSHMLNRFGCRTIALDVSPSALALGRSVFERDPSTNWALEPAFVQYDGHTFPLADNVCDRIIVNDAFHHVPNQRDVLDEMYRVLRPGGAVGMAEPGAGHGSTRQSIQESASTGVLENELVIEDVAALARTCGFSPANVVVASALSSTEIPVEDLGAFMGGKGFAEYWKALCAALEQHHYLVFYKGGEAHTTARPNVLAAELLLRGEALSSPVQKGVPISMTVKATNKGDTQWLSAQGAGWTRIGAHLSAAEPRHTIDFDWHRATLPADVSPGEHVTIPITLPAIPEAGTYLVEFDVVVEGVTWFATRDSSTATAVIQVI